jgi:hypothetical protein
MLNVITLYVAIREGQQYVLKLCSTWIVPINGRINKLNLLTAITSRFKHLT